MGVVIERQAVHTNSEINVYADNGDVKRLERAESVYITDERKVDEATLSVMFDITKSTDQGLVSGWASISVQKDGSLPLDWQDDVIMPETLEKAAVGFMLDYRESGVMHDGDSKGVVVESIVFTKEKQELLGIPEGVVPEGWFITVKVQDPETFAAVKEGKLRMFSIQGRAKRTALQ